MGLFSVRSMAARLSLGFGVILALLLGMALLALVQMQALASTLEQITVHNAARSQMLDGMGRNVSRYVQALGDLGSTDLEGGAAVLARAHVALADYAAAQTRLAQLLPPEPRAQALLQQVQTTAAAAQGLLALGAQLAEGRGEAAQAFQVRNEYSNDTAAWSARQQAWGQAVDSLSDWQDAASATSSARATADAHTARLLIVGGALLALALGSALAWWLVHDTRAAVQAAVQATRRMARHDLSTPIDTRRRDEMGGLLVALEGMRQNLLELATGVRVASDDIHHASGEIAQGSQDLSERTEAAASTLATALASLAQLTQSVQATTTTAYTTQTSAVAARSGSEMAQVVSTMGEIDAASYKIADIIAIIDGIAFQTNILALNAAVEAARAGEQGRGFAVVASEVRALAGRSAAAAKDIKGLIHTSLAKVQSGTSQVDRAGQTTAEVARSVADVSGQMSAIATGVSEQTERIGEVNRFVGELDAIAHQNAALAEQSAAAAASLRQQASQLSELVGRFELGVGADADSPHRATGPAVPAPRLGDRAQTPLLAV